MVTRRTLSWAADALREQGLSYPQTTEDFPWGERALKVGGKVFLFLSLTDTELSLSVKLPYSSGVARLRSFTQPTGYGLGKSGWVTARFAPGADVPLPLLREWLLESYYAVAPKRIAATLEVDPVTRIATQSAAAEAKAPARSAERAVFPKGTTKKRVVKKTSSAGKKTVASKRRRGDV
jgi:predicted DNA-binding protein (MmcQ/YjbR family)